MMDRFSAELMRGSLDLMVLSVLTQGSQYGYSLQQRLRDATAGRVRCRPARCIRCSTVWKPKS